MRRRLIRLNAWSIVLLLSLMFNPARAYEDAPAADAPKASRQYTFSWMFMPDGDMRPRGGNTPGMPVNLVPGPTEDWQAVTEDGLTDKERDRRAILAMAGGYRTSFDFIETAGYTDGYKPKAPYQSWGTEFVYVVTDQPDFISLQHILVMTIRNEDGTASEPIVVKHWRQDWSYENRQTFAYVGNETWEQVTHPRKAVKGTWSQAVFQVDDSPRYAAMGRWEHHHNYSSWISTETWRPLPRREFSVRDDYDVLVGTNRHTITPTGWVQAEDNRKVKLLDDGSFSVLATEAGLNRYERISGYDWSAGDDYWQRTGEFWGQVRGAWDSLLADNKRLVVNKRAEDTMLFMRMFGMAEQSADGDIETDESSVLEALEPFLER